MSRLVLGVVAGFALAAGTPAAVRFAATGEQPGPGKFIGVPRDIDYIKNAGWTQVILQGKAPTDELIAQTKNERIQSILLVALSLKSAAMVDYVEDKSNPKRLTSANLSISAKAEQGQVLALSFDEKDNTCRATVFDQQKKVNGWTKNAQMQGILEAAVRQSIPVQEFMFDAKTMEITRGKVNVSLSKK